MLKKAIKKLNNEILKNEQVMVLLFLLFVALILHIFHIGCISRFITGISCPGCGMTRAMIHVAKLDFKGAIYYHPLVFTLPIIMILFLYKKKINTLILNTILILIITAFLIVYIVRLLDVNNEVVYIDITKSCFYKIFQY